MPLYSRQPKNKITDYQIIYKKDNTEDLSGRHHAAAGYTLWGGARLRPVDRCHGNRISWPDINTLAYRGQRKSLTDAELLSLLQVNKLRTWTEPKSTLQIRLDRFLS